MLELNMSHTKVCRFERVSICNQATLSLTYVYVEICTSITLPSHM